MEELRPVDTRPLQAPGFPETADIETSTDGYASRFAGPVGQWFLDVQARATLDMLSACPGARVLDVGGGHGQLTGPLAAAGHRVTVLGSSPECSKRIREYLDSGLAEFAVGDVLRLPYPDRSFDVVISYRLLAHVTRWPEFLTELARVAARAVVIDYPEKRSVNVLGGKLFRFKKGVEKNTRTYTCFRDAELLEVFAEVGFRPADRYAQYLLPMALHRVLGRAWLSRGLEYAFRRTGLTSLFGSPVILRVERRG